MNGRAIPGAYLFRLYVCDKEMSWPHPIGETHQPNWVVYVRDSKKFRLTNVIPERIIFVSRGITVHFWSYLAQFFTEWEVLQKKVPEEIKTHILCSVNFFLKVMPFVR